MKVEVNGQIIEMDFEWWKVLTELFALTI